MIGEDVETVVERMLDNLGAVPSWYDAGIACDDIDPDATTLYYRSEGRPRAMGSLGNVRAMARVIRELRRIAPALKLVVTETEAGPPMLNITFQHLLDCVRTAERNCLAAVKMRLAAAPQEHAAVVMDIMMQEYTRC